MKMIKNLMLFKCLFLFTFYFSQYQYQYFKVDTSAVKKYKNLKNESFYNTSDAKDLTFYIKNTDKKYKLVYTFTYWCKPCRENHPKILTFKKNYNNVEIFYLTDLYDGREFLASEKYLKEIGNNSPIFSLTENEKMKTEKGKYKYTVFDSKKKKDVKVNRYLYYIQKLIPGHQDYGYSLIILYNENNKPVYASTYHETHKEIFDQIENVLKN